MYTRIWAVYLAVLRIVDDVTAKRDEVLVHTKATGSCAQKLDEQSQQLYALHRLNYMRIDCHTTSRLAP